MHAVCTLSQRTAGENKLCFRLNARVYTNSHVQKTHCTTGCSCSRKGYLTEKQYDYCQNCMKFLNTFKSIMSHAKCGTIAFSVSILIVSRGYNSHCIKAGAWAINRIYEHQNLLSLQLVSFLVGLRTYQHLCMLTIHCNCRNDTIIYLKVCTSNHNSHQAFRNAQYQFQVLCHITCSKCYGIFQQTVVLINVFWDDTVQFGRQDGTIVPGDFIPSSSE